jgi:hypothetical protein
MRLIAEFAKGILRENHITASVMIYLLRINDMRGNVFESLSAHQTPG